MGIFGIAPYLAPVLEQKRQRDRQTQQDTVAQQIQKDTAARQAAAESRAAAMHTANVGHVNAQTDALLHPKAPPHVFDQSGKPWIIDENGNFKAANIIDGSSPAVTVPSAPSPSFDAPPMTEALRGSMGLRPTDAPTTPAPVQSPTQAPRLPVPQAAPKPPAVTVQQDTTPKFGKAPVVPRIDPNSPAGIAADSAKVANRAALRPAGTMKIDPNSAAGISADSTKAANRAMLRPPGGMTGGMGSGGIGGVARTSAGITGMQNAAEGMLPFEEAVRSGKASFDGLDYYTTQLAKMFDAHGNVDRAIHAAAFAHLNKTNPALANYLGSVEQWALEDATVSGKPSDFRTKMDGFVSMIGPNPSSQNIDRVQHFRGTRIDQLSKFQPALESIANRFTQGQGGGRGSPPPNAPGTASPAGTPGNINLGKITPDERAALKANGFTDAQITAKYGPP